MSYQPPFEITADIVNRISAISEQIGRLGTQNIKVSPQLRKQNKIQTIQSTFFIAFMLEVIETALAESSELLGSNLNAERDQVDDQVGDQVSDQVAELLGVMDAKYRSAKELMTRLSLTRKATFRKNYLNQAIASNLVEMQYPESPRSPKQKYRKR